MCFQIPALMLEGLAIVVSPLIALMNDQVMALQQIGVAAANLHSNLTNEELKLIVHEIEQGKIKLLYVSPERLTNGRFIEFLKKQAVSFIAVDEAHCVSAGYYVSLFPDCSTLLRRISKNNFVSLKQKAFSVASKERT